jgi:hypothetical protein
MLALTSPNSHVIREGPFRFEERLRGQSGKGTELVNEMRLIAETAGQCQACPIDRLPGWEIPHQVLKANQTAISFRRYADLLRESMTQPAAAPSNLAAHVSHGTYVWSIAERVESIVQVGMHRQMLFPERLYSVDERLLHDAQPCFRRPGLSQPAKQLIREPPTPNQIELNRLVAEIACRRGHERSRRSRTEHYPDDGRHPSCVKDNMVGSKARKRCDARSEIEHEVKSRVGQDSLAAL